MLYKTIKINFCDWWEGFDKKNNRIYNSLVKKYNIEIDDNPEYLFYSVYGLEHLTYDNCVKIFINGENLLPNFNECDYGEGPDYLDFGDRYFRHNNWFINTSIKNRDSVDEKLLDRRFCNFIYANSGCGEGSVLRQEFCQKLMKYKHVDCPGKVLNNMSAEELEPRNGGNWWHSKLAFLKKYKFTIAFENCSFNGYTTEKLVHPLQSFSIPIYWGNPLVTKDFNPRAFINCNDYDNDFDAVIERVKELDNDPDKYLAMLRENPMQSDFDYEQQQKNEEWLYNIIEKGNKPFCKDPADWGTRHWKKEIKNLNYKLDTLTKERNNVSARIDITASSQNKDLFFIKGQELAKWMEKYDLYGYTIQKNDTSMNFEIEIKESVYLTISCKTPYTLNDEKQVIENWIDFTSLKINDREILLQNVPVCFQKPFETTIRVEKGDILNFHAEWKRHGN